MLRGNGVAPRPGPLFRQAAPCSTIARQLSVLPAPLSPLTTIDWSFFSEMIMRRARSATAYTCGGITPSALPRYASRVSSS